MNATRPAGIPKPQRVSDLGRLLNPEITAQLDSTARGVFNTSMAPAHLQGALSNICMASGHLQDALASPCARQLSMDTRPSVCHPTSKKINFLKSVAFPPGIGCGLAGGSWAQYEAALETFVALVPKTEVYIVQMPTTAPKGKLKRGGAP
mgnify:CR=1 FL=1